MAGMDSRWALTVWATARSWAADMAPGGLGSAGRCSREGTEPAIERARSVNPRSWLTNSSIERPTRLPAAASGSDRSCAPPMARRYYPGRRTASGGRCARGLVPASPARRRIPLMEVLSSRVLLRPTDPSRSRAFYGDILGLAVYREFGPPEHRGVVYFTGNGLLEVSGQSEEPPRGTALWFQVRDVAAEHDRLVAAGVTVTR